MLQDFKTKKKWKVKTSQNVSDIRERERERVGVKCHVNLCTFFFSCKEALEA